MLARGAEELKVPELLAIVGQIDARLSSMAGMGMDRQEQNQRFTLLLYTIQGVCYSRFNAALRSKDAAQFIPWRPFYFHLVSTPPPFPQPSLI